MTIIRDDHTLYQEHEIRHNSLDVGTKSKYRMDESDHSIFSDSHTDISPLSLSGSHLDLRLW